MPMEALTTYMAKDSAVAAPMGGALAVIAQRHATRSALKTSFCAWQQRHPYAGGTEALSPKGKSSPYRLRRLLMLTPQMPRVASGRAMRRALQTWQGEALAKRAASSGTRGSSTTSGKACIRGIGPRQTHLLRSRAARLRATCTAATSS